MTERLVVSNVNQYMAHAVKNPSILNVGGFGFLRSSLTTFQKPGCGKCSGKSPNLSELRPQWEAAFNVLSEQERTQLKALLNTKQLCYYVRKPNGELKSTCF